MAKQVVYLAPRILAKLAADPAIRQAVLAPMERDAELAAKTGQPIRDDPQRARAIIATSRARSRRGGALAATAILVGAERVRHAVRAGAHALARLRDGRLAHLF